MPILKKLYLYLFINVFSGFFIALNAQDCVITQNFVPTTDKNIINWKQFSPFSLPFIIIYSGPRLNDTESLPLQYGFSHLATFSGNENTTLPLKNRALLWYSVANLPNQPWNEVASPWNNSLPAYQQKWKEDLANLANTFFDSKGQTLPKTDILLPDIERQLQTDPAIRSLKNSTFVPDSYKKLDDATFTERYKRDLQKLYTEPLNYLRVKGLPVTTKVGTYADSPVFSTNSLLNYDWTDWQSSISVLNPLFKDTLANKLGGSFDAGLTTIFPSAYHCIESINDGRNLAFLLFQVEVNKAWTNKDIVLFEWLRYNRCQPTTTYNFKTYIKPSMAEAQAIFPFFSGAKGIWLWEDPTQLIGDNYNLYEYFIKGLYRLSGFKSFFNGNYQLIIPKTAHAHFLDQDPIWRGVLNGNKMLIAAQNPYAKDGQSTILKLNYGNFNKTITLTGTDVFLCQYDITLVTATSPDSSILLYPNPSDGNITLEKIAPDAVISMTDILGRKIDFEETILGDSRKIKFVANSISCFLKVLSKGNSQIFKVVLK